MINKFRDMEKKIVHIERKPYVFYTSYKRDLTFYVDSEDNILDIYQGTFSYLDDNILTISDDTQHSSYYNVNTGENLFKQFTQRKHYNVMLPFINGIALLHDWNRHRYEVINNKCEVIGLCDWLYRINKEVLFVRGEYSKKYSLMDYNFNMIKEDISCDYGSVKHNEKYILATRKETEKRNKYFIIDTQGNKVSEEYNKLETKDFTNFKYVKGKEKGIIAIDELIIK